MRLTLDHVAVLGETLGAAAAHVEAALGVTPGPGGRHARYGTHNRLVGLACGLYLEAIAVDPEAPAPEVARWFGLDGFSGPPRLDKWVLRVTDLDAALAVLPEAGRAVTLQRGGLRWSMAVPPDGRLPFDGLFPALIQWHSAMPPGDALAFSGLGLDKVVVRHPLAPALEARLTPWLDDPRLGFEIGAAGLVAALDGPKGRVWLR